MSRICPSLPRLNWRNGRTTDGLATSTHIFIRHNATRKLLQPPYNGPFPVVKRTDKYFTVDINGHKDTISVDRLKPAHLDV